MKYSDEHIQQQIESYLNQEMTDLERSRFEKQIHDDPELHEEVQLQEATFEAIKRERIFVLKAGLNQVPISLWTTGIVEVAKIAAITIGLGIAGLGGYYAIDFNSQTTNEKAIISAPKIEEENENSSQSQVSSEISANKGDFKTDPENEEVSKNANAQGSTQVVIGSKPSGSPSKIGKVSNSTFSNEEVVNEPLEPVSKAFQALSSKDIPNPDDGISNRTSLESIHPEVVFKKDNKNIFHYQFSDGKLILYADFTDKIYEVIELNQNGSKQVFFCYENTFYPLNTNQFEISPLKEVQDKNLIQILKAYQKRKN